MDTKKEKKRTRAQHSNASKIPTRNTSFGRLKLNRLGRLGLFGSLEVCLRAFNQALLLLCVFGALATNVLRETQKQE